MKPRGWRQKRRKSAEAEIVKILSQAHATKAERVQDARKDRLRFDAQYLPYKEQPELAKFRLFWDAVGKGLAGRPLMLIDSDKAVGKRNLMMFDPDQFRVPVPIFVPRDGELQTPRGKKDEGP